MNAWHAALGLEFVRNALAAGLLSSLLCGVIGVFVVAKRLTFISDGISHAAFAGLGLCFLLGADPRLGALVTAVLFAVTLGMLGTAATHQHDALIGVLYAVGMALGIVFVHQAPGYVPNLMTYLFGNLLLATASDLRITFWLTALVLATLALLRKPLVAVAFDEEFAFVQGVPVRAVVTTLLVLVSLSVVLLIQVVGVILVLALLTIPPLTAMLLARDLGPVIAISVAAGLASTGGGLALSYRWDLPSGPAIILLGAAILAAAYLLRALRRGARRRRQLRSQRP
ncbi:MAG TPA: metal ABC transporter permease [Thermoanaerobaculia bacterium]|nr:metal ABC transporter permease [Thermoanaerobaculia bacterium]